MWILYFKLTLASRYKSMISLLHFPLLLLANILLLTCLFHVSRRKDNIIGLKLLL